MYVCFMDHVCLLDWILTHTGSLTKCTVYILKEHSVIAWTGCYTELLRIFSDSKRM